MMNKFYSRPIFHNIVLGIVGLVLVAGLVACGDKLPESESAEELGRQPKKTIDRATESTQESLQQGAGRTRQEESK